MQYFYLILNTLLLMSECKVYIAFIGNNKNGKLAQVLINKSSCNKIFWCFLEIFFGIFANLNKK